MSLFHVMVVVGSYLIAVYVRLFDLDAIKGHGSPENTPQLLLHLQSSDRLPQNLFTLAMRQFL